MSKNYIAIKDFAVIAGVSEQSIYKRLRKADNPLKPYFKEVEGKKCLRRSALKDIYNIDLEDPTDENETADGAASPIGGSPLHEQKSENRRSREARDSNERLLDLLEQQLQEKDRQLHEKDKQIQEKENQINKLIDQIENLTNMAEYVAQLTDQQQKLSAADKGLLPPGNANTVIDPVVEVKNAAAESEESPEMDNETAAEPKKKGFFSWFRG